MPTQYITLKIHTTGENVVHNSLLCVGACRGNSDLETIDDQFQVFIKPPPGKEHEWEQKCLDELWHRDDSKRALKQRILSSIDSVGVSSKDAMTALTAWINSHNASDTSIIVSDETSYVATFINYHLAMAGLVSLNYIINGKYRLVLDSTSFHRGVGAKLPEDGYWEAEEAAVTALNVKDGLSKNPYPQTFESVNDAKRVCWEIMFIHRNIKMQKDAHYRLANK